jgi:hypothetical protein
VTVVETLLVFVAAPLAVYLLFWALTYLPGGRKRSGVVYKPGQPWDHEPVWYEPQPRDAPTHAAGEGDTQAVGSSLYGETASISSGHGSSGDGTGVLTSGHGSGSGHSSGTGSGTGSGTVGSSVIAGTRGATAASADGPLPAPGGPLGGARGTW